MDTVTPAMVEEMRGKAGIMVEKLLPAMNAGKAGIMVEKLLPAMNAQKQAGATEAMVNSANMAVASTPPIDRITSSYPSPGSAYSLLAPATESSGNPAANTIARVMPVKPPMRT